MIEKQYYDRFLLLGKQLALPESALTNEVAEKMQRMTSCLLEANEKFNLTAIKDPEEVLVKHVVDSLFPVNALLERAPAEPVKLLDIGSGAGFPALPLAAALPNWQVTAMDATKKKCVYIEETAKACGLSNVTVINGRAEENAEANQFRFHFVTARAVARFSILTELACNYLKIGGYLVALKGPGGDEEWQEGMNGMKKLGFSPEEVIHYALPEDAGERTLLICKKTKNTPPGYPRPYAKIQKNPL